ncbi:MAG: hypothetical protein WKF47_06660 [Geodermatophilaceae bacterium]
MAAEEPVLYSADFPFTHHRHHAAGLRELLAQTRAGAPRQRAFSFDEVHAIPDAVATSACSRTRYFSNTPLLRIRALDVER